MGSARERMVGQQIYDEVLVSFNWPSASGLAVTLVLLTLLLMFCALYLTRRLGGSSGRGRSAAHERPGLVAAGAVCGRGLCRAAGAAGCRHRGVARAEPDFEFPPSGLTLHWFAAFFASEPFVTSLFRVSLVVGLLAAAIATLIGTAAAVAIVRFRFFGREALETFFLDAAAGAADPARRGALPVLCAAGGHRLDLDVALRAIW